MHLQSCELAPGYTVPRIIVGLWQLSAGHRADGVEIDDTVDELVRFVEAGLDTFDCADIYRGVEQIVGALVRRVATPGRVRVHTKFVPDRGVLHTIDRRYVEGVIDRSLARLGVERLDLVQFAWWDYDVPGYVETMGWLGEIQREGKIRLLGTTNFDGPRLQELATTGVHLVSHQVQYSLLDRRPENGLVQHCAGDGSRLLCYGTLAGGFLSERWLDVAEPQGPEANRSLEKYRLIIEDCGGWRGLQDLLHEMQRIAVRHGCRIANVAARAMLDRDAVGAIIIGARNADHLHDNLRTLQLELDARARDSLRELLTRWPGPAGDVFGLERIAGGPHAAIMRYNLNRGPDGLP